MYNILKKTPSERVKKKKEADRKVVEDELIKVLKTYDDMTTTSKTYKFHEATSSEDLLGTRTPADKVPGRGELVFRCCDWLLPNIATDLLPISHLYLDSSHFQPTSYEISVRK